jgi:carbamate kinase
LKKRKIVIALGGNALGKNVEEQQEAVEHTAKVIVDLEQQGYDLIITHGNGPQVGMIQSAMNEYAAAHSEAEVPLSTSVAMSQGYIGFDLQNAIKDELYLRGIDHKVSTIISQVEVDPEDPAFYHPTKPIGRFMTREEAIKKEAKA